MVQGVLHYISSFEFKSLLPLGMLKEGSAEMKAGPLAEESMACLLFAVVY